MKVVKIDVFVTYRRVLAAIALALSGTCALSGITDIAAAAPSLQRSTRTESPSQSSLEIPLTDSAGHLTKEATRGFTIESTTNDAGASLVAKETEMSKARSMPETATTPNASNTQETTDPTRGGGVERSLQTNYSILTAPLAVDEPFAVVAVTWAGGESLPEGSVVQVRTLDGDTWSPWYALEADDTEGKDVRTSAREGTEFNVSGASTGIQVRVTNSQGELPPEMKVNVEYGGQKPSAELQDASLAEVLPKAASLIEDVANPETMSIEATKASSLLSSALQEEATPAILASFFHTSAAIPMANRAVVASPVLSPDSRLSSNFATLSSADRARAFAMANIRNRTSWSADPKYMTWPVEYAKFEGVIVHHTYGSNNYTQAQVPGVIRGIYHYHAVTREWGDIGYNVLIDKYGGRWEGRAGTLSAREEKMAIGAHAAGRNTGTMGISVMGDYTALEPSSTVLTAIADVAAWKFAVAGIDPTTMSPLRVPLPSERKINTNRAPGSILPRIFGHRDVGNTACPALIYNYLDQLMSMTKERYEKILSPGGTSDPRGWIFRDGQWYYRNADGTFAHGWLLDKGKWYFLRQDGTLVASEWIYDNGRWYYLGQGGARLENTFRDFGSYRYYFASDGEMATGWFKVDGQWYFANSLGYVQREVVSEWNSRYFYLDESGRMLQNQWKQLDGEWYYFADDGGAATGWFRDKSSTWYFADSYGRLVSNRWLLGGGGWYYVGASGAMIENAWAFLKGSWYYFDSHGIMATGWFMAPDGKWYFAQSSGAVIHDQWLAWDGVWYYFLGSGMMATDEWVGDYYLDRDGKMLANRTAHVKYGQYTFDNSGRWVRYFTPSGQCPDWAPIKGNENSGIFHVPGHSHYSQTRAEQCFRNESEATLAGLRKAKV